VAEGTETLSDHLYVRMELALNEKRNTRKEGTKRTGPRSPRWRLKDRDKEALQAAATVSAWSWDARDTTKERTVDEEAEDLWATMSAACDAAMPRVSRSKGPEKTVYWWNPEIAELREQCSQARRRFARAQRRRWTRNEEEISRTYADYRGRKLLQREIKIAKNRSWKELIESVESDPGGGGHIRLF
jgi:hypothetical protein